VPVMHIELPFYARVGSRHLDAAGPGAAPRCLTGYDDSTRKTSPEIWRENRSCVFLCLRWSPRMGAVSIRHDVEQKGHRVPERSTPEHGPGRWPGRPRLRGNSLSDLKRPVEFADLEQRGRPRDCRPPRQGDPGGQGYRQGIPCGIWSIPPVG
jgi:hypothetical protein